MMSEPLLPANVEAEMAVLGSVLIPEGRRAFDRIAQRLRSSDFLLEGHRVIFDRMRVLHAAGVPIDALTLTDARQQAGELEIAGGPAKVALLIETGAIETLVDNYVAIVERDGVKRDVAQRAEQLLHEARNGASPEGLARRLGDFATELADRLRAQSDDVEWALSDAADEWDVDTPEFIVEQLLPMTGVVWWGGLPKRGKSLLMLCICLAIACRRECFAKKFKVVAYPKILYVTREDGLARIKARREDILAAWGGTARESSAQVSRAKAGRPSECSAR